MQEQDRCERRSALEPLMQQYLDGLLTTREVLDECSIKARDTECSCPECSEGYWLNVYELGRHYGGPEEGGWWWDSGEPVREKCLWLGGASQDEAYDAADRLYAQLAKPEYRIGSVLYAGGEFAVRVERHPARAYPTERPRYE